MSHSRKIKVILVASARPNFMKCAPILKALEKTKRFQTLLVHGGQHYDDSMSQVFFDHLNIRKPNKFLGVAYPDRQRQILKIKNKFIKVVKAFQPDMVIVVGDVNSTLGAALGAKQAGARVAHVEAGLRSFDRSMPEEHNRIKTDAVSDILFTTSPSARINLVREGIPNKKIYFVGNVMIDTLVSHLKTAERSHILTKLGVKPKTYYLLTLHRPSNVDHKRTLWRILDAIQTAAGAQKIVFPVHPRTNKMLKRFGMLNELKRNPSFIITKPLGYLDFLKLLKHCRMVFTDSGGIQEETAYLAVNCLTLRNNTERPVTVEAGNNVVAGNTPKRILQNFNRVATQLKQSPKVRQIKHWDGKAAQRIVGVLLKETNHG